MATENKSPVSPDISNHTARGQTPSPMGSRQRPTSRSATFNMKENELKRRRSSLFSETLSETHKSFRSGTDDLFLPRITTTIHDDNDQIETSHWHSVPLGLALLPAVGGLFFQDGSAVVTDITLLGLAAIFLNWALRLPWEWYKAAQATVAIDELPPVSYSALEEDEDGSIEELDESETPKMNGNVPRATSTTYTGDDKDMLAAQQELRIHQILALVACFVFPILGAWLLHATRSQLSRPSEGLVSNYNLTIFLLVAELRPLSHTIKLVQKRTLFLQRKVNSKVLKDQQQVEESKDVSDLTRRLEELEAHIANGSATASMENPAMNVPSDVLIAKAAAQATTDLRKAFQPELDALNRAMRRYEKRMTITAIQVESRLQDLEMRLKDVVVLAAAAQRNADKHPRGYFSILVNWVCAVVVVPVQYAYRVLRLPGKAAQGLLDSFKTLLHLDRRSDHRDNKSILRSSAPRPRVSQKKVKATT